MHWLPVGYPQTSITAVIDRVHICLCVFQMPPPIEDRLDCEVCTVIRAKEVEAGEFHRQICNAYGQNIMTDGLVRKWVRTFKDGRKSVQDEERSR